MSIVAITGDHPRHTYLVSCLKNAGLLSGWVRETRESFVPKAPNDLNARLTELYNLHFERREEAEQRFFGDSDVERLNPYLVERSQLNSSAVIEFIRSRSPRVVISYGCHKLSAEMRESVGSVFWNTHGGLSPQYRGVITHFWPSYMLEPQFTGMTLHETTDHLDGGAVIHQTAARLVKGDGLHDLCARTVKAYADEISGLLKNALDKSVLPRGLSQANTGKLWTMDDWRPEHLGLIYETYGDRIVDRVLDGTLKGRTPKLTSVL